MAPNDHPRDDSTTASLAPEEGDVVSWKWSGGQPSGMVSNVTTGETQIQTQNGYTVARHGTDANPAVEIIDDTTGHKVLKKASEVQVEEKFGDNEVTETHEGDTKDSKKDVEDEARGEKRSEPDTPGDNSAKENKSTTTSSPAKKVKITHYNDERKLDEKLEGKGLTKDDKEIVKDHVVDLTTDDMKEPVSRRTRSKDKEEPTTADEAVIAKQIFQKP